MPPRHQVRGGIRWLVNALGERDATSSPDRFRMPVIRASVAGKPYSFLLDTGGQYCVISDAELGLWRKQYPDRSHVDGVYGPANMQIGQFETRLTMLREHRSIRHVQARLAHEAPHGDILHMNATAMDTLVFIFEPAFIR
jgi:hypothetical protein